VHQQIRRDGKQANQLNSKGTSKPPPRQRDVHGQERIFPRYERRLEDMKPKYLDYRPGELNIQDNFILDFQ
jgi:hypothetical protein